jgi:hypothetical protein
MRGFDNMAPLLYACFCLENIQVYILFSKKDH